MIKTFFKLTQLIFFPSIPKLTNQPLDRPRRERIGCSSSNIHQAWMAELHTKESPTHGCTRKGEEWVIVLFQLQQHNQIYILTSQPRKARCHEGGGQLDKVGRGGDRFFSSNHHGSRKPHLQRLPSPKTAQDRHCLHPKASDRCCKWWLKEGRCFKVRRGKRPRQLHHVERTAAAMKVREVEDGRLLHTSLHSRCTSREMVEGAAARREMGEMTGFSRMDG